MIRSRTVDAFDRRTDRKTTVRPCIWFAVAR